jgi:ethanolamine ammonia-lyase small subunit
MAERDPFARLRLATAARIGLGRAGQALPTAPMLALQLAHARARDAVSASLDVDALRNAIMRLHAGPVSIVDSAAPDRLSYLRNPGLGRRLGAEVQLRADGDVDLAVVVADGLSARAVHAHAPALVAALRAQLHDWRLGPIVIARLARVAIGDPIGEALRARASVVLIGERPGLSAADSLGAYITWAPAPGRRDSERNCVSNIRTPGGMSTAHAAGTIAWLLREARTLGASGVSLKLRYDPAIGAVEQA